MADAVSVLRQEITRLEQEITKRRKALSLLTGSNASTKSAAAPKKVPAKPQPAPRVVAAATPAVPSLATQILTYLTTNTGKRYSAVQIAEALRKTDATVTRENVQRRLGELVKAKKIRRNDGQYGAL